VTLSPTFFDYTPSGDEIICTGETAVLSIQNNNPGQTLTYLWTPQTGIVGPNDQSSVTVMPLSSTTYTVQIELEGLGCTATETFEVEVSGFDPPNLVITVNTDSIVLGESFVLSTNQDPTLFYFWDGPGIVNPNLAVITAEPGSSGIYSYAVTITNSDGCRLTGSISNLVVFNPPCNMDDVFIPDAFSPNSDGQNDILLVYGNFIDAMELRIFNRWGEMVFESFDQLLGWDGTYKGKELAPDVFGYYLMVECPPDKTYFTKGNITLFK
jgi:gliding motility-associated-like protein